jgi:KipI family sensor histidine kinase inhibitor
MPHSIPGQAGRMPAIEVLGEDALLLRFGDTIDVACNMRVHALAAQIKLLRPPWLRDIVPGYASLALFVDPTAFAHGIDPITDAAHWLRKQAFDDGGDTGRSRTVEIHVSYGGEDGPDMDALAAYAGLTAREVIERHVASEYTVAMLGFAPGFPYLLGLGPALSMPRLQTPRTRVAAGSVGIGGAQTGIYPRSGAGGWQIIGRTSQVLFNPTSDPPSLLAPGDRVRFIALGDGS